MGTLRVRENLGGPVGIHVCTISASWPTDILSPLLSTLSTSLLRPAIDPANVIYGARCLVASARTPTGQEQETCLHTDVLVAHDHELRAPNWQAACMRAEVHVSAPGDGGDSPSGTLNT
jgi:hypothetical protein